MYVAMDFVKYVKRTNIHWMDAVVIAKWLPVLYFRDTFDFWVQKKSDLLA